MGRQTLRGGDPSPHPMMESLDTEPGVSANTGSMLTDEIQRGRVIAGPWPWEFDAFGVGVGDEQHTPQAKHYYHSGRVAVQGSIPQNWQRWPYHSCAWKKSTLTSGLSW